MKEDQSNDILPPLALKGRMVLRFKYPDGRLTATIAVEGIWQVAVFASEKDARKFAKEYGLTIEEMKKDED